MFVAHKDVFLAVCMVCTGYGWDSQSTSRRQARRSIESHTPIKSIDAMPHYYRLNGAHTKDKLRRFARLLLASDPRGAFDCQPQRAPHPIRGIALAGHPASFSAMAAPDDDDLIGLGVVTRTMQQGLQPDKVVSDDKSDLLCELYKAEMLPFISAVYDPNLSESSRKESIEALSRSLDLLEEAAVGPRLAGMNISVADTVIYPAMSLLQQTLPQHFGWSEWTPEAIFYKRPRVHAWMTMLELLPDTKVWEEAREAVTARLAGLELNWTALAMDVPTLKLRKIPAHANI